MIAVAVNVLEWEAMRKEVTGLHRDLLLQVGKAVGSIQQQLAILLNGGDQPRVVAVFASVLEPLIRVRSSLPQRAIVHRVGHCGRPRHRQLIVVVIYQPRVPRDHVRQLLDRIP